MAAAPELMEMAAEGGVVSGAAMVKVADGEEASTFVSSAFNARQLGLLAVKQLAS